MKTKPLVRPRSRFYVSTVLAIAGLTIFLTSPTQASNVVTNGGFDTPTALPTVFGNLCGAGVVVGAPICPTASPVAGWTGSGLVAVFTPFGTQPNGTSADTIGAQWKTFSPCTTANPTGSNPGATCATAGTSQTRADADGAFRLWGPGNSGSTSNFNGNCPACVRFRNTASDLPNHNGLGNCNMQGCGGNFMALDGDFATFTSGSVDPGTTYQGEIHQAITGLTPDKKYDISFFWGGAQQTPRSLPAGTPELKFQLLVGLCPNGTSPGSGTALGTPGPSGSCGFFTHILSTGNHGFTGWKHATNVVIEATQSNETLSFLAIGTPSGVGLPPIVLLDGVSATEVQQHVIPEPGTWLLLGIGFAAIAGLAYRRPQWLGVPA